MAIKSLISQARQIRASKSYADIDLGDNNSDRKTLVEGAEYLESDMNNIRSMIKDITGEEEWSDIPQVTLAEAAGASNKLIIQPVQYSGTANGSSLVTDLDAVAGVANTTSTEDLGYVVTDEETPAEGTKAHVSIRDAATNMPIVDANEQKVYAVAYNDSNDKVELKFFVNDADGNATEYTFDGDQTFEAVLPNRTTLADANEQFPMVNAGWADAVGAFEIGDRVYTDGVRNDGTTPVYDFVEDEDLTSAINKLATVGIDDKNLGDNVSVVSGITSATYTTSFATDGANYLADEDTLIAALMKLDAQAKENEDAAANASSDKVVEILTEDVAEATAVTLPESKTYKNDDKDALDVLVNGQALVSDAVAGGDGLGDYAETSTTEVTFNFPLEVGDVVTYKISKEA